MRRSPTVCIFCLRRSALSAGRSRPFPLHQQRLLRSSTASPRPASAAVAEVEEGGNEESIRPRRPARRTLSFDNELTKEERAARDSLRQAAPQSRQDTAPTPPRWGQQRQRRQFNFDEELTAEEKELRESLRQSRPAIEANNTPSSVRQERQRASLEAQWSGSRGVWKLSHPDDHPKGRLIRRTTTKDGTWSQSISEPLEENSTTRISEQRKESHDNTKQLVPPFRPGSFQSKQHSSNAQDTNMSEDDTDLASNWTHVKIRKKIATTEISFRRPVLQGQPDGVRVRLLDPKTGASTVDAPPVPRENVVRRIMERPRVDVEQPRIDVERPRIPVQRPPILAEDDDDGADIAQRERQFSGARFVSLTDQQPQIQTRAEHASRGEQRQSEQSRASMSGSSGREWSPRVANRYNRDDAAEPRRDRKEHGKKSPRRTVRSDDGDEDDEAARKREIHRQRKEERRARRIEEAPARPVLIPEFISIANLASLLRVRVEDFSSKLRDLGFSETNNDYVLDAENAGLIASEFNFEPMLPSTSAEEDLVAESPADDDMYLLSRPPVITIMGHVDHGKTTLLDWLRKSSIAASEHGGITQHIGAFTVEMPSGRTITFLDTPGHAAFLDMRARGANVTDIVILVVAADDSVKPQTIEAIKHAKAARVPIIVAINKMDKEDADPSRVKQDLARHGVEVEDYGGETQTVEVSGKTGQGMEELEDAAIALADVLDVRADTTGATEGWVLEAARKSSGKVATVLVRKGTLQTGQVLVAGTTWTRVRTLRNEAGQVIDSAGPGTPVEVDGWREQPVAGAEALQASDEQKARRVIDLRLSRAGSIKLAQDVIAVNESRRLEEAKRAALEATANGGASDETPADSKPKFVQVPLIVRADVSGSVEALTASLLGLGNSEIRPLLLKSEVGAPSEGDLELADTARGHIVAFGVPVDGGLIAAAEKAGVKVIDGSVIYRVVDEVKAMLEERLPPLVESRVTGEADVAAEFEIGIGGRKKLKVAGCRVRNGVVVRGNKVKVLRKGKVVHDGESLREGVVCGLGC